MQEIARNRSLVTAEIASAYRLLNKVGPILVGHVNPLHTDVFVHQAPSGLTIAQLLVHTGLSVSDVDRFITGVRVGGYEVPRHMWPFVTPKSGVTVELALMPQGSDSSAFEQLLAVIAIIVVAQIAGVFVGNATAGGGITYTSASGATTTLISYQAITTAVVSAIGFVALNSLFAPDAPDNQRRSENFSISGTGNRANLYGAIPKVFGFHRLFPPFASRPYTRIRNDEEYLYGILTLGYGPGLVSEVKVGNTDFNRLTGSYYEVFRSELLNLAQVDADTPVPNLTEVEAAARAQGYYRLIEGSVFVGAPLDLYTFLGSPTSAVTVVLEAGNLYSDPVTYASTDTTVAAITIEGFVTGSIFYFKATSPNKFVAIGTAGRPGGLSPTVNEAGTDPFAGDDPNHTDGGNGGDALRINGNYTIIVDGDATDDTYTSLELIPGGGGGGALTSYDRETGNRIDELITQGAGGAGAYPYRASPTSALRVRVRSTGGWPVTHGGGGGAPGAGGGGGGSAEVYYDSALDAYLDTTENFGSRGIGGSFIGPDRTVVAFGGGADRFTFLELAQGSAGSGGDSAHFGGGLGGGGPGAIYPYALGGNGGEFVVNVDDKASFVYNNPRVMTDNSYFVSYIPHHGYFIGQQTALEVNAEVEYSQDISEETFAHFLSSPSSDQFIITVKGDHVEFDFNWPAGIYRQRSDGDRDSASSTVTIRCTNDANATPQASNIVNSGFDGVGQFVGQFVKNGNVDPERASILWQLPDPNTDYTFDVDASDGSEKFILDCYWTKVRTYKNANVVDINKLILLGYRLQASDHLSGQVDSINVEFSAHHPIYDADTETWSHAPTSNPAWQCIDVLTGCANPKPITYDRLDLPAFLEWAAYCDAEGFTFNQVSEQPTSVISLFNRIAAAGRGSLDIRDGLYSVVVDMPNKPVVQHFSPRNSWNFQGNKEFVDIPHALRMQFINPDNPAAPWTQDERVVYDDDYNEASATDILVAPLQGITSSDLAWRHGRFFLAVMRLRQERFTIFTDFEHLVAHRGDRVRLTHDVALIGIASTRITSLEVDGGRLLSFTVEDFITPPELTSVITSLRYSVQFRTRNNKHVSADLEDVIEVTKSLRLANPLLVGTTTNRHDIAVDDMCHIGLANNVSADCIIERIEPQSDMTARLTLMPYSQAVFTSDTGTIPPHDSNITRPAITVPGPPLFVPIRDDAAANKPCVTVGLTVDNTLVGTTLELQYRDTVSTPVSQWTDLTVTMANPEAQVKLIGGIEYEFRARYVQGLQTFVWVYALYTPTLVWPTITMFDFDWTNQDLVTLRVETPYTADDLMLSINILGHYTGLSTKYTLYNGLMPFTGGPFTSMPFTTQQPLVRNPDFAGTSVIVTLAFRRSTPDYPLPNVGGTVSSEIVFVPRESN